MNDHIFQQVTKFMTKKINPDFIIIFGSYATGTTHSKSDIDIAFYRDDYTFSAYELFMTSQELADTLTIEVDLIDLKEASTVFAAQIFSTGKVIYSKNANIQNVREVK